MSIAGGQNIDRNLYKLDKPIESGHYSGNFAFSYGHLILNAGYDKNFDNVFNWEEPYQTYLAWKAGYKLYNPHQILIYHMWDRSYRPKFSDIKSKRNKVDTN